MSRVPTVVKYYSSRYIKFCTESLIKALSMARNANVNVDWHPIQMHCG